MQRVRELTVQATTGTNSDSDLSSIQDEIKSRLDEIDRVSGQTQFNGVNVLAKDGSMKIQVGANDGQTISIDLQKIDSSTLGLNGFSVSKNAVSVGDAITQLPGETAADAPVTIKFDDSVKTDLKLTDDSGLSLHNLKDENGNLTNQYVVQNGGKSHAATVAANGNVTLNKANVTYSDVANGIDTATQSGQLVQVGADSTGTPKAFVSVQGKSFGIDDAALKNNTGDATATQPGTSGTTVVAASIHLSTGKNSVDADVTASTEFTGASTNDPLTLLDKAIASVDKFRSSLGAVQNRLSSAVTNLNNTTTNLSEAQSRIHDADYATEVSNMSKAQIIQQAGNSVLSKANQVPQQVLSLLQG